MNTTTFHHERLALAILFVFATSVPALAQKNAADAPTPEPDTKPVASVTKDIKTDIVIEAEGQAYFNSEEQIVVFQEDVVVNHPGFHIECEELEVFLKGNPVNVLGDPDAAEPDKNAPTAATTGTGDASDSVDKIFARGKDRLVALTKFSPDPSKNIRAKCGWATYDSTSGDLILHDWPVLNQGNVSVQSTAKDTIIYVRENGDFEASGPATFQRTKVK
ncbi:MAG: hypothetical protein R3F19_00290 [Verrucomicrobiales bacterium]